MKRGYLFFALFCYTLSSWGQKHDYIWLMGQNSQTNPEHAGNVIDFNNSPPDIYYEFRDMYFYQVNASICDTAGNLLFYTNGIYVANALNEPMENGQGLNPGQFADDLQEYGYILDQGAMILPVPEHHNLYYLLHLDRVSNQPQSGSSSRNFYITLIDISKNNGLGTVLFKSMFGNFILSKQEYAVT